MRNELLKHRLGYLVLIIGLISLGILFFAVWPNHGWQRVIALLVTLLYFIWGVVTHYKTKLLNRRIIMEYLGAAILAGLALMLITI